MDLVIIASSNSSPMEGNTGRISFDVKAVANVDVHKPRNILVPVSQERRRRCLPKSRLHVCETLKEDLSTIQSKGIVCNGWNKPDDVLVDETAAAKITLGVSGGRIQKPLPGMARTSTIGHIKKTQKPKSGIALCQETAVATVGDDIIVGN